MVRFTSFTYKGACYRIASDKRSFITSRIRELRTQIEQYIHTQSDFGTSLTPLPAPPAPAAPLIIHRMDRASKAAGVGPMAAVAGAIAQLAAEEAAASGASDAAVDNGGDIYLAALQNPSPFHIGLFASPRSPFRHLAFRVLPSHLPLGICSSSGTMGHSFSFGSCDLATVFASDGALADAAATAAANAVTGVDDVEGTLHRFNALPGIRGIVIIKDDTSAYREMYRP